jgi:Uma2 family endonuclease
MENNVSTQPRERITPEEYLELERRSEIKHEYLDGEMFAMPGVTRKHNLITLNIAADLNAQFLDRPCEVYGIDLRAKVRSTGLYTYPDIAVVCGQALFEDEREDTLMNPQVIIEVLSDSTESCDRGKKFAHYRVMESLREYLLVSQSECRVERFARQDDGNWIYSETTDPNGSVELMSVASRLPLSRVYHRIEFRRDDNV